MAVEVRERGTYAPTTLGVQQGQLHHHPQLLQGLPCATHVIVRHVGLREGKQEGVQGKGHRVELTGYNAQQQGCGDGIGSTHLLLHSHHRHAEERDGQTRRKGEWEGVACTQ
jgi:hypothetical protein